MCECVSGCEYVNVCKHRYAHSCLGLCLHLHTFLPGICTHLTLCVFVDPRVIHVLDPPCCDCGVCAVWRLLPVASVATGPHLLLCLLVSPSLPPDSSEVFTPLRPPRDSCGVVGV